MIYLRHGDMEIKKQAQVFITVSHYFRMQIQKETTGIKEDTNRKFDEKLHDISYMGKISRLFAETILERAYLLDGRIFCVQCRECFIRNAEKIHRKPGIDTRR